MVKQKDIKNLLEFIPVRNYEWNEKDLVTVKVPRFRSRLGRKFCRLLKKESTFNVNLDKQSSYTWKLCNGKRTVKEIGDLLKEEFGEEIEPVYARLGELLRIMEGNKLITLKRSENNV
jgi:hypothetical protein